MNMLWKVFLAAIAGVALVFSVGAFIEVLHYASLNQEAKALVSHWEIREKGTSAFSITGSYVFFLKGKEVAGKTELAKPYFLNERAAKEAVDKLKKESWTVFYEAGHPEKSSLQRFFPFLACIRSFLALGVFVYFILLGRWFRARNT
jgi:hypothetical protein